MPITPQQISNAQVQQHAAAHDLNPQVRLIAGPGSGKSFAIRERVYWLLDRKVSPENIYVISFTRASTLNLRNKIRRYCHDKGQHGVDQISVSTLHSLALRALRTADLLTYPSDPLVLDDWELKNVFDKEFSSASGYNPGHITNGYAPGRCEDIRRDYKAFCGTGHWLPPNHIPPDPPITPTEHTDYRQFHTPRTQTYSCVLPGEIVRQCVVQMAAGNLDPAHLLDIHYLIVDEYQDLNPSDLEFVDNLITGGVNTFVAGDDDQSIYSFRFASPEGIRTITNRYPQARDYQLTDCFRCTTEILGTSQSLIANFADANRIPKQQTSLYAMSSPPEHGMVYRWRFSSGVQEARSIASSCSDLINGISPREIMILVSNKDAQLSSLTQALCAANVEFEPPKSKGFFDTAPGRFVLAILRIVCNPNDYIAHRLILGLRPYVGAGICNRIAGDVIANNLNYRDIFYQPLPGGVFRGRQLSAINNARIICGQISNWTASDTLASRSNDNLNMFSNIFGQQETQSWLNEINHLPQDITLEELRDYLWADTDEQRAALLEMVYTRLELPVPAGGLLPQKVRIMTMHAAKGLEASIVFVPGLMEEILPGDQRRLYPGLVLEAARLLYVSITRARAACILTYSRTRIVYGQFSSQAPSRFTSQLAGPFVDRNAGLTAQEVNQLLATYNNL